MMAAVLTPGDRSEPSPGEPLAVAVVGGPAFARDLVVHVLQDAGAVATKDSPDVTVAIDLNRASLTEARELGAPFVVLVDADAEGVVDAIARGADGVLNTDVEPTQLVEVLNTVSGGHAYLQAESVDAVVKALRTVLAATLEARVELTPRELQILESIDRGESVKQTSRALSIASKTVENLQSRLFRRLGVRNRAQAVAVAHELGLLPVDPAMRATPAGG